MAFEAPRTTTIVEFCDPGDDRIVAAHTDSIQSLIITASHYPELKVMIKGRVSEGQEERIASDPLFKAFTSVRAERQAAVNQTVASKLGRLGVEMSSTSEPFRCNYFSMNTLVEGLLTGEANGNNLLINFGGATHVEIGSDKCKLDQLERFGDLLKWGVRTRQLGEVTDSILQKSIEEPLRAPSELLKIN